MNWKYGRAHLAAGLLLIVSLTQTAYWVHQSAPGIDSRWENSSLPLLFRPWEGFDQQLPKVVPGSDLKQALVEALNRWIQVSSIPVVLGPVTPISETAQDGTNLITLADKPANVNIVGGALAVSISWWIGNQRLETDVIFGPGSTWSTIESSDTSIRNFFHVAEHELGHSLNLGHTIGRRSIMIPRPGGFFDFGFSQVSWDDLAGISKTYKLPGLERITGSVSGRISRNDTPIPGAFVAAIDEHGVFTASALSDKQGLYKIESLPKGKYSVYVEPLDGPVVTPADIQNSGISESEMVTDFLPRFYNDLIQPTVSVMGEMTGIDISVDTANAAIDPVFLGTDSNLNDGFRVGASFAPAFQDGATNFITGGTGVDELLDSGGVQFSSSDVVVSPSIWQGELSNGDPFSVFPISVDQDAPTGPRTAYLRSDSELGIITGALEVFPLYRFSRRFAQFIHVPGSASSQLFVINADLDSAVTGRVSARTDTGTRNSSSLSSLPQDPAGDRDLSLAPGGSGLFETAGSQTFVGSLHVEGDHNLIGTALIETAFGTTGVGPSNPLYHFIAPVQVEKAGANLDTGFAITNLEERNARIYVRVNDRNGGRLQEGEFTLPPRGQTAKFIRQLLNGLPGELLGTAVFTSDRLIGATVIRTAPGVFTTFPVIQARSLTTSYFAQFAHIGGLSSTLLLVNPSPTRQAAVTVQVRNASGSPAPVRLNGADSGDGRRVVAIPPLGYVSLQTEGPLTVVGSVQIESELPVGGIVLFSGPGIGTAGVGESFPLRDAVIPIARNTAQNTDMGIAAVNPQDESITLEVIVRNQDGEIIRGPKDISLNARQQLASFPNEAPFSLNLSGQFQGSLWIRVKEENKQVALTAIRQSPGVLTTFPAASTGLPFVPQD